MNRELKAKWVSALKSGKYKQGKSKLCRNNCYCVLGVLADLTCESKRVNDGVVMFAFKNHSTYYSAGLPSSILPDKNQAGLIILNDSGRSFEEIIPFIEREC